MSTDILIPAEDWVSEPDQDVYDTPCPVCSAMVENRAVHRAFHIALVERADRYVSPPVYGGMH